MNPPKRNIELKWRCGDLHAIKVRAGRLGAEDLGVLHQRDTFFNAQQARLKLREFGDGRAELISYRRDDAAEARGSDYFVYDADEPERLAAALEQALGTYGTLRKRRHLLVYRHTRIHLDEVEGLGGFVELETVVSGQSDDEARAELEQIAGALGLKPSQRVALPYVDLLHDRSRSPSG